MTITPTQRLLCVTWEKLPDNFLLPDDPVDNLQQPLLATALSESLGLANFITPAMLIGTNFGLCVNVDGKTVVKAPDWFYIPQVFPISTNQNRRSYTPRLEGDIPAIVMEFVSETDGGEYSLTPYYPFGKWYFYEQILQVPIYVIFYPLTGVLEVRELQDKRYQLQKPDAQGRYFISSMNLALGVWQGSRMNLTGYWLRWWNQDDKILPWPEELVAIERLRTEQERLRAEQERLNAEKERLRANRLAARLRELGITDQE